jgi:hypothetical protein
MSKVIHKPVVHPPSVTVGELLNELCRLPDAAAVSFRCPMLEQEFTFLRLRKRSKNVVEIEINARPESPPIAPSADAA